jgi:nucleoside-diphosphate-sugar epimerase
VFEVPRLIVGAVYKKTGATMKTLWTKELRLNTVHVDDVARALWHVALHGKPGAAYNVADKADSTQDSINTLVWALFAGKCTSVLTLKTCAGQPVVRH